MKFTRFNIHDLGAQQRKISTWEINLAEKIQITYFIKGIYCGFEEYKDWLAMKSEFIVLE
jgi:hypothetical protein